MALQELFPEEIVTADVSPGLLPERIFPEEWKLVSGAVTKRQAEFCGGRICAHRAMERLGFPPTAILANPDRTPVWPAGLTGSISHTSDYCCAAVARSEVVSGIGLDVEGATPLAQNLMDRICTPSELDWLNKQPDDQRGLLAKLVFCIKEAAYKCQYPLTRQTYEFSEAECSIDRRAGTFSLQFSRPGVDPRAPSRFGGRFAVDQKHFLAGTCLLEKK